MEIFITATILLHLLQRFPSEKARTDPRLMSTSQKWIFTEPGPCVSIPPRSTIKT